MSSERVLAGSGRGAAGSGKYVGGVPLPRPGPCVCRRTPQQCTVWLCDWQLSAVEIGRPPQRNPPHTCTHHIRILIYLEPLLRQLCLPRDGCASPVRSGGRVMRGRVLVLSSLLGQGVAGAPPGPARAIERFVPRGDDYSCSSPLSSPGWFCSPGAGELELGGGWGSARGSGSMIRHSAFCSPQRRRRVTHATPRRPWRWPRKCPPRAPRRRRARLGGPHREARATRATTPAPSRLRLAPSRCSAKHTARSRSRNGSTT